MNLVVEATLKLRYKGFNGSTVVTWAKQEEEGLGWVEVVPYVRNVNHSTHDEFTASIEKVVKDCIIEANEVYMNGKFDFEIEELIKDAARAVEMFSEDDLEEYAKSKEEE